MSAATNPYQSPTAPLRPNVDGGPFAGDVVAIRNEFLRHEAGVRSIGVLYYLYALMFVAVAIAGLWWATEDPAAGLGIAGIGAAFCALFVWMGIGIRKLNPRVRTAVGITAGIGLLNLPVGTLIHLYILYLVFGAKGKVVFSGEYARVRQQTPDLRYRTPLALKVLVAMLLALVMAGLMAVSMES